MLMLADIIHCLTNTEIMGLEMSLIAKAACQAGFLLKKEKEPSRYKLRQVQRRLHAQAS